MNRVCLLWHRYYDYIRDHSASMQLHMELTKSVRQLLSVSTVLGSLRRGSLVLRCCR